MQIHVQTQPDNRKVELLEAAMLTQEQADIPLEHVFVEGMYMRQGKIMAGTVLVGHEHRKDHLNVLLTGKISVVTDGVVQHVVAPCVFVSHKGAKKIIYAHEDSIMANVLATDATTTEDAEAELVIKSETFELHQQGIKSDMALLAQALMSQKEE